MDRLLAALVLHAIACTQSVRAQTAVTCPVKSVAFCADRIDGPVTKKIAEKRAIGPLTISMKAGGIKGCPVESRSCVTTRVSRRSVSMLQNIWLRSKGSRP